MGPGSGVVRRAERLGGDETKKGRQGVRECERGNRGGLQGFFTIGTIKGKVGSRLCVPVGWHESCRQYIKAISHEQTNRDAHKHAVHTRSKREHISFLTSIAKANAQNEKIKKEGWDSFWKCYNNTRPGEERKASSGFRGNKSVPSLRIQLFCVEGDLSCLL